MNEGTRNIIIDELEIAIERMEVDALQVALNADRLYRRGMREMAARLQRQNSDMHEVIRNLQNTVNELYAEEVTA